MRRLSVLLVISCVSSVLAQVQATITTTSLISITPAPSVPASGLPQGLIGYSYVSQLGGYTTWDCSPGSIWSTVGSFARCCTNDPYKECGIATACLNTSLLVGPGSEQIWTCSGTGYATSCITGTVYYSISGTGFVVNIDCYTSWSAGNWNATRNIIVTSSSPPTITTPSTITTASLAPGTTPSSIPAITATPSQALSPSQTNPTPSQTPSTSTPSSPNLSTVAIAISVSILVTITIATICFCTYRRRRKQRASLSSRHRHDSHDSDTPMQQLDSTVARVVAEADGANSGIGGAVRRDTTTTVMTEIYTAESTAQTRTDGLYQLDAAARSDGTVFHSIRDEEREVAV